jgi:hypothetical protein
MTELKVNSCSECPFRVIDYSPESCGFDTIEYCNHIRHFNKFDSSNNGIIDVYNSFSDEDEIRCNYCQMYLESDGEDEFDESMCNCSSIQPSEPVVPDIPKWCPLKKESITVSVG